MHNAHYDAENDTEVQYTVEGADGTGDGRKCIHVQYSETGYEIENQFEYMNAYASGYSDTLTDKDGNVTATQVTAMRNATKGILWSVANSNAMQNVPPGAAVVYGMSPWLAVMIALNVLVACYIAVMIFISCFAFKDGRP